MSKDLNIIDLLSDTIARRFPHRFQERIIELEVTGLDASRAPARLNEEAASAEHSARDMSPAEILEAVSEGRIVVHYQPQYDMGSGIAIAAEALVRLVDSEGCLVYPGDFIGYVEERDLVGPLGRAVIQRVCADLAGCRAEALNIRRVAVNLSAHQLAVDTGLLSFVDATLEHYGLRHTDLEFELTERHSLTPSCAGHNVLNALAQRGSRIVIDDFGVGYSSVIYLAELPVAAFKLDRTLVERAVNDSTARTLVEGLLALADNMGLDVIAEGVETKAQSEYLETAGCPLAQGFGYARPMPIDDFKQMVAEGRAALPRLAMADPGARRARAPGC